MNTYQVSMIVKTDKTGQELLLELRAKIKKVVCATVDESYVEGLSEEEDN